MRALRVIHTVGGLDADLTGLITTLRITHHQLPDAATQPLCRWISFPSFSATSKVSEVGGKQMRLTFRQV
jgi:hypothetical protein